MEFDVSNFYDAPSAELEGKRAFLSNSMSGLFYLLKYEDFTKLCKVSMSADGVPFEDEDGNFYKYAYHAEAFDNIESPSTRIFNELCKLSSDDVVEALFAALEMIPCRTARNLVHKLLEWDSVIEEVKEAGFVSTDDKDAIIDLVKNDDDMAGDVFNYYKDNGLSYDEKVSLIKDLIQELL